MAAGLVGQHQQSAYSNPQAGQAGTASVVLGNDNTTAATYSLHDADATIHLQSSTLAARPAASAVAAGGKWMTSDTLRLFYSDASSWFEAAYLTSGASGSVSGNVNISGSLRVGVLGGVNSAIGVSIGNSSLTGAVQVGIASAPTFNSAAVTSGHAVEAQIVTVASAFTMTQAVGVYVAIPVVGAGSAVTTGYGILVDDQSSGGFNATFAIRTLGAAICQFGGGLTLGSGLTVQANGLDVTGAATMRGQVIVTTGGVDITGTSICRALLDLSAAGAGQIQFPATQNATSGVNVLDDYKEGTWTPSVGGSATYTTQVGTYTKIGRLVIVTGTLTINTIGTGSTSVISGLPYTVAGTQPIAGCVSFWASLATNVLFLGCYANNGATTLQFTSQTAAGANVTNGPTILGNSAEVIFTISYMAAT